VIAIATAMKSLLTQPASVTPHWIMIAPR
jgi:hypothetical protein